MRCPNAHLGPCGKLATLPEVDPAFAHIRPLIVTPKGIKWLKRGDEKLQAVLVKIPGTDTTWKEI